MSEKAATTRRQFGAGRALNSHLAASKGSDPKFTCRAVQSFPVHSARRAGSDQPIASDMRRTAVVAANRMAELKVYSG